jgi:hypothetical protein
MKTKFVSWSIFMVLFVGLLAAPYAVSAAGLVPPCGGTGQTPCHLCDLVKGFKVLIDYARTIMVFIALAVITAMGILYIVSAGNDGMMQTAKKGIYYSLGGVTFILFSWLIVNTVMFYVLGANLGSVGVAATFNLATGFTFDCDEALSGAVAAPAVGGAGGVGGVGGAGGAGAPGGPSLALCTSPAGLTPSINVGQAKVLYKAYYNATGAVDCTDLTGATDVTNNAATAWASSNAGMASVANGNVTGGPASGAANVSATYSGITAQGNITVVAPAPGMLVVCPGLFNLVVGGKQAVNAVYKAVGAPNCVTDPPIATFDYWSDDDSIMKPDPDPMTTNIMGVKKGNTNVWVEYTVPGSGGKKVTASAAVFVN